MLFQLALHLYDAGDGLGLVGALPAMFQSGDKGDLLQLEEVVQLGASKGLFHLIH